MRRWMLSGLVFAAVAFAQAPPSADSLLSDAQTQAQSSHRVIFAMFHASW
jgi:hypothetical protein